MTQRAGVSRVMIGVLLVVGAIPLLVMMALIVGNSLGRVFLVAAYLLWAIVDSALASLSIQEATIASRIPIAPFKFLWAAGILILCLYLALHLIEDIVKSVKGVNK
jgi:hypothetical protein